VEHKRFEEFEEDLILKNVNAPLFHMVVTRGCKERRKKKNTINVL